MLADVLDSVSGKFLANLILTSVVSSPSVREFTFVLLCFVLFCFFLLFSEEIDLQVIDVSF